MVTEYDANPKMLSPKPAETHQSPHFWLIRSGQTHQSAPSHVAMRNAHAFKFFSGPNHVEYREWAKHRLSAVSDLTRTSPKWKPVTATGYGTVSAYVPRRDGQGVGRNQPVAKAVGHSNFQVKRPAAKAVGDARNHTRVPWHQDGAHYDLQPQVLVSAWIAVTGSAEENGCLKAVAGSHLQTFDHEIDPGNYEFGRSVPEDAFDHDSIRAFAMRPGEYVLFNENTVHSSGPDQSLQPRVGLTPRISVPFVRVAPGANAAITHRMNCARWRCCVTVIAPAGSGSFPSPAVHADALPRGSAANDGVDFVALTSDPFAAEPCNLKPFFGNASPIVSTILAAVLSLSRPN